jgi:ribulose-5-phosphate 4-epimerase/fuculose-1-phosphate aldolase
VSADPLRELREKVALGCRILGARHLVDGVLGHISARVGPRSLLVRCRGPHEEGVARTRPADIRLVDLDGNHLEDSDGWQVPKELPIHTRLLETRPDLGAVVHAHPPEVLVAGLAELPLRPIFGSYNIPAMRLALDGVPVYGRSVLISRTELADEMLAAMGQSRVCILHGHGITVAGTSVEQAVVTAIDLNELCAITVRLAALGVTAPEVPEGDHAELPDLGSAFNDELHWRSLVAELGHHSSTE